jgi:phosphoribosylamine--glycine ligase
VSISTSAIARDSIDRVFLPTLAALRAAGSTFTGLLYAGLMLTRDGPKVVEFNCRFGDPETETLLPLMASGLLEPLRAVANGDSIAGARPIEWRPGAAVTTVVAAEGYPGPVRSDDLISLPSDDRDVIVFHAGTKRNADGALVTAGGRVLAVTARAQSLEAAQKLSASHASLVQFAGRQYRRDIAWRDLARQAAGA